VIDTDRFDTVFDRNEYSQSRGIGREFGVSNLSIRSKILRTPLVLNHPPSQIKCKKCSRRI